MFITHFKHEFAAYIDLVERYVAFVDRFAVEYDALYKDILIALIAGFDGKFATVL